MADDFKVGDKVIGKLDRVEGIIIHIEPLHLGFVICTIQLANGSTDKYSNGALEHKQSTVKQHTFKVGDAINPTWDKSQRWIINFVDHFNNCVEAGFGIASANGNAQRRFFSMNDIELISAVHKDYAPPPLKQHTIYNPGVEITIPCQHDWKMYIGLNEQYYFCTNRECDEKKALNNGK